MSSIGSPLNTSLIQTAQAQQSASKTRDREKAEAGRRRRHDDFVELRVEGVDTTEAVRRLPHNESEQAETEHESQSAPPSTDDRPRIDVQA